MTSMTRWVVSFAILSLSTMGTPLTSQKAALAGKVTDVDGTPLAHATVLVYHAGVKKGYSTFCPSCYVDCGKRAITDTGGTFNLHGLSEDLWFDLLVLRDGYT